MTRPQVANRGRKRVVAVSDMHCGSIFGLTPPGMWHPAKNIKKMQRELWGFYEREAKALGKVDAVLAIGDLIDGKGLRQGGLETFESDMMAQAKIAAQCLGVFDAKQFVICAGTPYHSGQEEDFEQITADILGASFGGHEWAEAYGVVFDLKHKIGSSAVPHGRHTAMARERLWNQLWALRDGAPKADILLRAHVHYFNFCGGPTWLGMTLPALQGLGSRYGVRQCSGVVDFGFVHFDIYPGGSYTWEPHLLRQQAAKPVPVKL